MSSRASGGAFAACLIISAIVGFAGGAYMGTRPGSDGEPNSEETVAAGTPGGEAQAPGDGASTTANSGALTLNVIPETAAPNSRIDIDGEITPAEEGVELRLERSVGGGEWTAFDLRTPLTTDADGAFSTYVESGQEGPNAFRVVRVDDDTVVSNEDEVVVAGS